MTIPRLPLLLLLFAITGAAFAAARAGAVQEGATGAFHAELSDGGSVVAPVRSAPVPELTITRTGPDGELDASFDWGAVQLDGVVDLEGRPIGSIADVAPAEAGTRATRVEIEGGTLLLRDAVLVGPLDVALEGARTAVIERSLPGWVAIVGPLVAIVFAMISRQVIFSLFMGVLVGAVFIAGSAEGGFALVATEIVPSSVGGDQVRILMFSGLLGGIVALVARMGGSHGLVNAARRVAKGRIGSQVTTWVSGIFVFFDDYANALLVGNTMRPITDKMRISREKLSYLVDSTSAPVACIFVVSTWIATEIGLIQGKLSTAAVQAGTGLSDEAAYSVFLRTIPYSFYPLLALAFGLFVAVLGRDFGPMLKAERRALHEGKLVRDGAQPLTSAEMDELEPADPERLRWFNAVLPIGTVVLTVVIGLFATGQASIAAEKDAARSAIAAAEYVLSTGPAADVAAGAQANLDDARASLALLDAAKARDILGKADTYGTLMLASFLGIVVAVLLALGQRLMSLAETFEVLVSGIKSMMPAFLVLILAWSLQTVCTQTNTSQWLIHQTSFSRELLPVVVFLLSAAVGFSTGSSWGTMGIIIPLTIDYAVGLGIVDSLATAEVQTLMISSIGGVLAGAVFGDHCSPISDTTIMSSMACGSDHIDHVKTQMPYAIVVAAIAVAAGYLPAGYGVSPWISLLVGVGLCFAIVRFAGRRADDGAAPA